VIELPDLSTYALVCELYVFTHSFFLAPKARNSIASLGDAPGFIEPEKRSAESAIHCKSNVSRAFSACYL
jgi:hypothetical protein